MAFTDIIIFHIVQNFVVDIFMYVNIIRASLLNWKSLSQSFKIYTNGAVDSNNCGVAITCKYIKQSLLVSEAVL